eukprot:9794935-Karenia_brevis.AAC.1
MKDLIFSLHIPSMVRRQGSQNRGVKSTCRNGGLIEYFITSPDVAHSGQDTQVIIGAPASPH